MKYMSQFDTELDHSMEIVDPKDEEDNNNFRE